MEMRERAAKLFGFDFQNYGTRDKLLRLFWPLLGPFYFIYIKICQPNDQSLLSKYYALNSVEILLEALPQMIIQWSVIANHSEIFEVNSHIPGTKIEYNKFAWAIFSAVISTVSVLNGLRLLFYDKIKDAIHVSTHTTAANNDQ